MRKVILPLALGALLSLGACATNTNSGVNLTNAQAAATSVVNALDNSATVYEASPNADPTVVSTLEKATTALNAALAQFNGVSNTSNAQELTLAMITAAEAVEAALPLTASQQTAVTLGMAMLEAFLTTLETPAPAVR